MPIEIKELHIRVAINAAAEGQTGANASAAGQSGKTAGTDGSERDALVAECVEQVLEILKNKTER